MSVYILTSHDFFDFVYESTYSYKDKHQIHISTQPYVILGQYDVGISFMHRYKVPAEEVNAKPWFNFHPAPLPEYKGRDLCYHAIMNGEKEFGATIHYMDEDFDTGDIIMTRLFPIQEHWTAEDLSNMAIAHSKQLFIDFLPKILENTVFPRVPNVGGVYYKKGGIEEEVPLHDVPLSRWIRAVTYKNFYPKIDIRGVKYKIVREE